jgi:hypothetical protein
MKIMKIKMKMKMSLKMKNLKILVVYLYQFQLYLHRFLLLKLLLVSNLRVINVFFITRSLLCLECNVTLEKAAKQANQKDLHQLIQQFLSSCSSSYHIFDGTINIYPSALAVFHSSSDISSTNGICKERIRCVQSWRKGPARHDTVFVKAPGITTMSGLTIARVRLLFKLQHNGIIHSCALVHDYNTIGDKPDKDTGMWMVQRALHSNQRPQARIISLAGVLRAAHLIPVYNDLPPILKTVDYTNCLDHCQFHTFYVNRYIDDHAFKIL